MLQVWTIPTGLEAREWHWRSDPASRGGLGGGWRCPERLPWGWDGLAQGRKASEQ